MSDAELSRLARQARVEPTMENLAALGMAYLRYLGGPQQTLRLMGRRWFSRTHGNTYHTVRVFLDDELLGESPIQYGYGDQYEQTGLEIALANSDLPPKEEREAIWQWAERVGIKLERYVTDVPRKRDL